MEQAVALALERSPRLISTQADAAAARAQLSGASLLFQTNPDLQVAIGPRFRASGNNVDVGAGVSQQLELFGQRGARRDAAAATLSASESRLAVSQVELAAEVRQAFGRALAAEQELQLANDALVLAEQGRDAAEQRLQAGAASRIEVNTARVALGQTQRARVRAVQRRTQALGELRLLLGIEPTEDIAPEGNLRAEAAAPPILSVLLERAAAQRADLKAAKAELEAAQAEVRLASRGALPRPRLGVSYSQEEDAQIVQGTLGIDLPLFNRNQAARGISTARAAQAERALAATERFVRSEVVLALERYRTALSAAEVFGGDVMAAVQENLKLINEAYRAGKVDFLELLIIRREALDTSRSYIEALEELNAAEAQLKKVVGNIQ
ncbi:TolC family protein [Myxococcus sp. AM011]|nr:TolC family protein [Myxococcus sp. AM011]NVJ24653.1 TolC family protein [Myxococcus sp. AM011]